MADATVSAKWERDDGGVIHLGSIGQGDVISWQVRTAYGNVFDYAAIKSRPYNEEKGNPDDPWMWHITGAGAFYKTPIVTTAELIEILDDRETSGVWLMGDWAATVRKDV